MSPTADELAATVEAGLHVDVVGLPMSGRTTLLHAVADRLKESSRQVVRVSGIRSFRERPLIALAVLDLAGGAPAQTSASDLVRTLIRLVGGRPSALVIDDVDDLDAASIGVVHAAHRETGVPVITARRSGSDDSQAVQDLLAALHPGITVEAGALAFDEVHQLVHDLLPGAVDPATIASIAVLAGRLPGLACALVATARAEGAVVHTDGMWRSTRPVSTRGLGRVVAPILGVLEEAERDALAIIALADHPALSMAERLVGGDMLRRLERRGVAALAEEAGFKAVVVVPPALAEYVGSSGGGLWRANVEAVIAAQRSPTSSVMSVAADPHVADSILSRRLADHWEAERRLRHEAWNANPTAATASELMVATLVCSPSTPTPEEIHAATDTSQSAARDVIALECLYAQHLAFHRRSLDDALAHLDASVRRVPAGSAKFGALRAHLRTVFDEVPASGEIDRLLSGSSGHSRATLADVQIEGALVTGATTTARQLLRSRGTSRSELEATAEAASGLSAVLAGEVAQGTELALAGVAAARTLLDPGALQAHAYVAALGLVVSGRFRELDALVASCLSLTTRTPHEEHFRAGVLALAAIAAGWQGRADYARRLAFQARALDHRTGLFPAMVNGPMLAVARSGDLTAGSEEIWETAQDRLSRGYLAAGLFAAVASIERRPDLGRGRIVEAAARGVESPLLGTMARYAAALSRGDVDELRAVERDFTAMGTQTYAVRSAVSAAIAHRQAVDRGEALAAIRHAWVLAAEIDGERSGLFQPYLRSLDLSPRELEIVEMASTGLTAAEVGGALSISPRTVENHLFAAYRKLGMDNRDDLRIAVGTWMAPQRA